MLKRWIVMVLLMVGCQPQPRTVEVSAPQVGSVSKTVAPVSSVISFLDRTKSAGVHFAYRNDEDHSDFAILESLGGGVAILDFDRDNVLDLFLPGGGVFHSPAIVGNSSALLRGSTNWRFADVAAEAGVVRSKYYNHGAAVADYNEDGFDDILITGYGGTTFYQNQGDGSFRDVELLDDRMWSSSAAWGDFNGDGVLDVYVAHYVDWSLDNHPLCAGPQGHPREVCPPRQFEGVTDVIYFGNGDGAMRNATTEAGLKPQGKGLGVVAADLDLDGDLDLYVTNDTVPNFLYMNTGNGAFDELALISGTAVSDLGTSDGSMGVDVGDYNQDGLPDLWVTNYERENNAMYRNLGKGLFRHVSRPIGIAALGARYVGWGTRFLDVDLDGDEDLIVANGHVIRFPQNTPRLQRPLVLENIDGARYGNVTDQAGEYLSAAHCGRGLATGDLDDDGDEDVVISNLNEPVAILSNETNSHHNWLTLRVIGRHSTRTAIGTVAVAKLGKVSLLRQIRGGSSFASTSDSKLHFGCGPVTRIDELTVTWISGACTILKDVACNQVLTIVEPATASN
ncbi:MAG: CRTAC1 family protein [Planctomycetes bacterium]|nr:CRTAC1 family protein [Planctomycetota bacterium]